MKLSYFFFSTAAAALTGFFGWQLGHRHPADVRGAGAMPEAHAPGSHQVLYFQSAMHPWIKSDHPGNCPICGMKLVPIFADSENPEKVSDRESTRLSASSVSVIHVETAPVIRQPLQRTIRVAGTIDDDDTAHRRISAYVEGRIDQLYVNSMGAEVVAGQPLVGIYSRDLLIARGEFLQAVRRPESPERDIFLRGSRQKLRRMGLTDSQIDHLAEQTGDIVDLVAPITGTIVERKVYPGQYVKEGDPIFEIADFSKMWFVFDAYERDLAWLRLGQSVDITTPSVVGKIYSAPIAFIDPNVVMETRTAKVRVILENPPSGDPGKHRHELLHQLFAEGRVHAQTEPVLTVPRTAVLATSASPIVYIAEENGRAFSPRRVTLGRSGDDVWEVMSGVQEGERVVTTGNMLIDAQAQLDRPQQTEPLAPEESATERAESEATLGRVLQAESEVAAALSRNDLAQYQVLSAALKKAVEEKASMLAGRGLRLEAFRFADHTASLAEARAEFYPAGLAVADLTSRIAKSKREILPWKIFECPMAGSVVPNSTTSAGRWVQASGPLRNPFFGPEMLDCGKEVRP